MRIQLAVFSYYLCLLSALRIVASGNATETEYAGNVFVQWFAQNLAEQQLFTFLRQLSVGTDEVSWEACLFVTPIHDEGDNERVGESNSWLSATPWPIHDEGYGQLMLESGKEAPSFGCYIGQKY